MRYYVVILLVWALLMPSVSNAAMGAANETAEMIVLQPVIEAPSRDGADEDTTIVFEEDFENGQGDWIFDQSEPFDHWHITENEDLAYDGGSWWCADDELGGYLSHWLEYLITPTIDLTDVDDAMLTFKVVYNMEDIIDSQPEDPYDGWDGANVWISTDEGESWDVIEPAEHDYQFESLYSFGEEWGMGDGIPGWAGISDGWQDAAFDLSDYAGEVVMIRWAFCSDPAWDTGDHEEAFGFLVDNLQVSSGDDVIWENDASEEGDMTHETVGVAAGDFWEITDEDANTGEFSANCPVEPNLLDCMDSPWIHIPEEGWYTWFEFFFKANTNISDSDDDNALDDYFQVFLSTDGLAWKQIFYDYGTTDEANDPEHYEFHQNWSYYGPDVWFHTGDPGARGYEEWQWKLSLTDFAGDSLKLRWRFSTDSVQTNDEWDDPGTGLWIDDIRVLSVEQWAYDLALEEMNISYPATAYQGNRLPARLVTRNYGVNSLNNVYRRYTIPGIVNSFPILPLVSYESGEVVVDNFQVQRLSIADEASMMVFHTNRDDQNKLNDTLYIDRFVIYPPGVWEIGYDNRMPDASLSFSDGNKPAMLFTPSNDRVGVDYDIRGVQFRWDGEQEEEENFTLSIFEEDGNGMGDLLYSGEFTVTLDDVMPNTHYVDLRASELHDMSGDFWVQIENENESGFPKIMSRRFIGGEDDPFWGWEHNIINRNDTLFFSNFEFQIQAFVADVALDEITLLAGRSSLPFGTIIVDDVHSNHVTYFPAGRAPVTVTDISVDNEAFMLDYEIELPAELNFNEMFKVGITVDSEEPGEFEGVLTVMTDDQQTIEVAVSAEVIANSVGNEATLQPVNYELGSAFPNPFNAVTTIPYALPNASEVRLSVYDLNGREVAVLASGAKAAGRYVASFNALDLANGVYFYRLQADGHDMSRKIVLIK